MGETVDSCKTDIKNLKEQVKQLREKRVPDPENVPQYLAAQHKEKAIPDSKVALKSRRVLKGHFGKIYALHWATHDSKQLVSASQDGKLLIWNANTTNKLYAIPLRSSWVMTCAFSPSGDFVASGGLDNLCTVYRVPTKEAPNANKTQAELAQHEGYLSCCRFIDNSQIVSCSGDSTCILWDIDNKSVIRQFTSHTSDVMSIALKDNLFVSGSVDNTARLWDHRAGLTSCVKTFIGHESDINSITMFPDTNCFGTGSDDSTCRLWDVRSYGQINKFSSDRIVCGITSVAFSNTGKFLIAGYDDNNCGVWSTSSASLTQQIPAHENRVSCLGVSCDGKALCTGSWDTILKVWA